MKPDELVRQVDRQQIAPVYFLHGDDDFSKEEVLQHLRHAVVEPGTEAFSLDTLTGGETDGATILTLAATLPMLSPRRVVVVKEFQRLSQLDKEAILRYAARPNPTTCLILLTPKVDLKTKLYERLCQHTVAVDFVPLYPEKLPAWLQQRAGLVKKAITMEACQALLGIVGSDPNKNSSLLRTLVSELEKLAVYVGTRQFIQVTDVKAMMAPSRAGNVFDLAQAVGEKDLVKAYRALSRALDAGETPYGLVAVLVRHLTILWKIRLLGQMQRSEEDMKAALKLGRANWHFPKYAAQAKRLSRHDLLGGFESLLEADLALKTSTRSPRLVMERLVSTLCRHQ